MWTADDDLICDGCGRLVQVSGDRGVMMARVRAKGWHLYEGPTLGGSSIVVHLCEACTSSPRTRLPAVAPPLQEDQTLF